MNVLIMVAAIAIAGVPAAEVGQEHARGTPVAQAFEHYEGVRVALSADKLADVAPHAKKLAESVEAVGGADAKKHADALASATTLDAARQHFGELSTILVPIFQAAKIAGTNAFFCPMKKQTWIQKGQQVENPYFGKSMLTCGSPLPPK